MLCNVKVFLEPTVSTLLTKIEYFCLTTKVEVDFRATYHREIITQAMCS